MVCNKLGMVARVMALRYWFPTFGITISLTHSCMYILGYSIFMACVSCTILEAMFWGIFAREISEVCGVGPAYRQGMKVYFL
jgi:hypothetical protein